MMNEISLGKNILWMLASRFGGQIIMVVTNLLLARYLGSAGFGEYAFISAVVLVGNAFSTFGTDMVLIRKISASQDYSDMPSALAIQLLISFLFIIGVFLLSSVFHATRSLQIYIFALFPLSFFTVFTIALRGAQYMGSFSLLHFSVAILQLASILILFAIGGQVRQLAFLFLGVQIISAIFGFVLCASQIKGFFGYWRFSPVKIPPLILLSARMALIGTSRLIYEKLGATLLPALTSISVTGLFSASVRVLDAAKLGHMSALTVIYPEMARAKNFHDSMARGYGLLFLASILLSAFLFLFAGPVIYFLFGDAYASSVASFRILAWTIIPYFIVSYYSLAFVAVEVEQPVLVVLMISLTLLAALLFWWSPIYGLRGAAFAVLFAEIFQAALLWFQWRRYAFSK